MIFRPPSGLRKSLSKKRSEKHHKRSMNKRCDNLPVIRWWPHFVYFHCLFFKLPLLRVSTSGDLLDLPAGISPSGSVSSMPSCLPFPWFSERGREKEADGGRERLRSVSSSSLPYLTTTGRRDQVRRWGYTPPKKWDHCKAQLRETLAVFAVTYSTAACRQPIFPLLSEYWLACVQLQHGGSFL